MKAKELAGYLMENPEWEVEFWFTQGADEIEDDYTRAFGITNVGDNVERKVTVLVGKEAGRCSGRLQ
ncbi:MAG: hypothetical protein KAV87_64395 [Desulfobacteraceae bacterium]|nr:hypothetical protein [Desulfobacteraceae bacterium]